MAAAQVKVQFNQALKELQTLMPLDHSTHYSPEDLKLLEAVAEIKYQDAEYEQALPLFERLALHDPNCSPYWMGLATCWQKKGKYEEALKAWDLVILLDAHDPLSFLSMAECYEALGMREEGKRAAASCKQKVTDSSSPLFARLRTLEQKWEKEKNQKGDD